MTATRTELQQKAEEAASWFEVAERIEGDEDSRYTRTKNDAPEWVTELVYEAHGEDFLPDDWRYEKTLNALEFISESDDPEDDQGEFADSAVDIYTGRRFAWLASNLNRASYCDEAAAEFGAGDTATDIVSMVGWGQYAEANEVYGLVLSFLRDSIEEA